MITKEQAIEVITQALNAATLKGVYSLLDTRQINIALDKVNELVEIIVSEE